MVEAMRLDTFCRQRSVERIDYLKIDTEGGEYDVLTGAEEMLRAGRVKFIQFEYGGTYPGANTSLKQVCEFLSSFGYSLFRILPDGLLHIPKWRDELETYRLSNYLAVSPGENSRWKAMEITRGRTTGMVVFSKDRAIQLDGALRSLYLALQGFWGRQVARSGALHLIQLFSRKAISTNGKAIPRCQVHKGA